MASTQKKKTTTSSGGARTAGKRSSQNTKSTSSAKGSAAKKTSSRRPVRREVGGIVCLLLALCVLVSFFNEDGWLIALLPMLLKGLFGLGYYVTVPALCVAAVILLTHRGRPVVLRTTSALLLPCFFGILCHLLFCRLCWMQSLIWNL